MKKMMLVTAACAMVVAPSALMASTVTSVNVVGYYTVDIPTNRLALITPVLESIEGAAVSNIFSGLPDGTTLHIWDRDNNQYLTQTRTGKGGWGAVVGAHVLLRGDAVWVQPPADQALAFSLMGEVPGSYNLAATTTIYNLSGVDAVGYSYPVDVLFSETALYEGLLDNSTVHFWNMDTSSYSTHTRTGKGGWGAASNRLIRAGEAFWVQPENPGGIDWVEVVPYSL